MTTEIDKAIRVLVKKITSDIKGDDALKLTQAALNLAHTAQVIQIVNNVDMKGAA